MVETEEGLKPIEKIEVGDKVLAYDEQTGEQAYKPVVQLFRLENHTVHALIFEALYIASEEESYERIAERYFIDCSTLKRYVKRYNRFAERYINAQKCANCPFDTSTGVLQSI